MILKSEIKTFYIFLQTARAGGQIAGQSEADDRLCFLIYLKHGCHKDTIMCKIFILTSARGISQVLRRDTLKTLVTFLFQIPHHVSNPEVPTSPSHRTASEQIWPGPAVGISERAYTTQRKIRLYCMDFLIILTKIKTENPEKKYKK